MWKKGGEASFAVIEEPNLHFYVGREAGRRIFLRDNGGGAVAIAAREERGAVSFGLEAPELFFFQKLIGGLLGLHDGREVASEVGDEPPALGVGGEILDAIGDENAVTGETQVGEVFTSRKATHVLLKLCELFCGHVRFLYLTGKSILRFA